MVLVALVTSKQLKNLEELEKLSQITRASSFAYQTLIHMGGKFANVAMYANETRRNREVVNGSSAHVSQCVTLLRDVRVSRKFMNFN